MKIIIINIILVIYLMGMNYNYQSDNNPEMNIFPDERDL